MILEIKVIPKASRNYLKEENQKFKAYVTAPPEDNRANKAVLELLARHFNVRKSALRIVKGMRSPHKVVQIII